jgi:hypothetical protein
MIDKIMKNWSGYLIALFFLSYGILELSGVEFRYTTPYGWILSFIGGAYFLITQIYENIINYKDKDKDNQKYKDKKNYKKIILTILGFLYLVAYLFDFPYTNSIGMFIALGMILYTNGLFMLFK